MKKYKTKKELISAAVEERFHYNLGVYGSIENLLRSYDSHNVDEAHAVIRGSIEVITALSPKMYGINTNRCYLIKDFGYCPF